MTDPAPSDDEMVVFASCQSAFEAGIFVQVLQAAGIHAEVVAGGHGPSWAEVGSWSDVMIRKSDKQKAEEFVERNRRRPKGGSAKVDDDDDPIGIPEG